MQGLPRVNMITLDLRESNENPEFSTLNFFIESFYRENSDNYKEAFKELLSLRQTSTSSSESLTSLANMKRYFCQLQLLKARFVVLSRENSGVTWHWEDSASNTTVSMKDIRYEEASIMYNIACLHCNLGAKESRVDLDSTKIACTHFQCATWAFQNILDKYTPLSVSDLECDLLRFLNLLMMAEAHECVLEKSMVDQRRATITAKIAFQISDFYKQCQGLLRSENIGYAINSRHYKNWKRTCIFKEQLYLCLSYYYMALMAEETGKFGETVAWMKLAKEKLDKCMKPVKELKNNRAEETIKFVQDVVNGKLDSCVKDNNFIYYEKVPDPDMLPPIKGAILLKGIAFDVNDPEICGKDIFRNLIPMATHVSLSIYSEKKAEILRSTQTEVENKDEEIQQFLNDMQWDDDNLSLSDDKVPQELFSCAAFVTTNPEIFKTLKTTMQDISNISIEVEESLEILSDKMRNIKIDKSLESWKLLEQDYSELIKNFEDAKESNFQLREAFDHTLKDFEFVNKPMEEVLECLPTVNGLTEIEDSKKFVAECTRLLDKVDEMKKQRSDLLQQLKTQIMNDDITQLFLGAKTESDRNKVIEEALKKFDELLSYLNQNMNAQGNIKEAIVEHNAKMADIKMKIVEIKHERRNIINRIIRSFNTYGNIVKKGEEGNTFYQKLSQRVSKLQKEVDKLMPEPKTKVEPVVPTLSLPKSLPNQINDSYKSLNAQPMSTSYYTNVGPLQPSSSQPLRLKDYLKDRNKKMISSANPEVPPQIPVQGTISNSGINPSVYEYVHWGFYGPPSGQTTYTPNYSISKCKVQDSEFRTTQNVYLPAPASEVGTDHSVYLNYSSLPRTNYSSFPHFNSPISSAASSDNLIYNSGFTIPYQYNTFNNPNVISMAHGFGHTAASFSQNKVNSNDRHQYISYPYVHEMKESQYFSQYQNLYNEASYVNNTQQPQTQLQSQLQPQPQPQSQPQAQQHQQFSQYPANSLPIQPDSHYSTTNKIGTQSMSDVKHMVPNDQGSFTSNFQSTSQMVPQNQYIDSRNSNIQPNISQYYSNNASVSNYTPNQCSVSYSTQENFPQTKQLENFSQSKESFSKSNQLAPKQSVDMQNYSQSLSNKSLNFQNPNSSAASYKSDKRLNATDLLSSSPTNEYKPENSVAVLEPKILTKQEIEDQKEEKRKQTYHKQHSGSKHPLNDHLALNKFISDAERFLKKVNDLLDSSNNSIFEKHWNQLIVKERNLPKKSTAIAKCSPMKNRMQESVPYDENRVVIKDGKDDYINASHILLQDIDECFPRFITCQSPLVNTVSEFWTAIFEQGCEILVQLASACDSDDTSKGRVVTYWPDPKSKNLTIGSKFEISVQSFKEKPSWNERILLIKHLKTNQSRSVWHFQVHNMSNKLPKSLDEFLTFETELCRYYRQQRSLTKPIAVSCINGSSVCGVFVLLTSALLQMEITGIFPDIDNILLSMWQQRKNLVDDKHQLMFVYKAISKASSDILSKRNIVIGPGRIANTSHTVVSDHSSHSATTVSVNQISHPATTSTTSIINSIFTNQHLQLSDLDSVLSKWTLKPEENPQDTVKINEKSSSETIQQESELPEKELPLSSTKTIDIQLPSTLSHLTDPSTIDFTPTPPDKRKMTKKEFEAKLNNTYIQPSSNSDNFDPLKALDPIHLH